MKRFSLLLNALFLLFITSNCSANIQYIGYYADEFNPADLIENSEVFFSKNQKEDIENEFDSMSFFYKTTSKFKWLGKEQEIIDYGYLIARKDNQFYILGKYTPTVIYNAAGDPIIEIINSDPIYDKIVGLNEDVVKYPSTMSLNLRGKDGAITPVDPVRFLEIDIPNRSIIIFDPWADFF